MEESHTAARLQQHKIHLCIRGAGTCPFNTQRNLAPLQPYSGPRFLRVSEESGGTTSDSDCDNAMVLLQLFPVGRPTRGLPQGEQALRTTTDRSLLSMLCLSKTDHLHLFIWDMVGQLYLVRYRPGWGLYSVRNMPIAPAKEHPFKKPLWGLLVTS